MGAISRPHFLISTCRILLKKFKLPPLSSLEYEPKRNPRNKGSLATIVVIPFQDVNGNPLLFN